MTTGTGYFEIQISISNQTTFGNEIYKLPSSKQSNSNIITRFTTVYGVIKESSIITTCDKQIS